MRKPNVALKTVLMNMDVLYSTLVISIPRFQSIFLATTIQTLNCYRFNIPIENLIMNVIQKPRPLICGRSVLPFEIIFIQCTLLFREEPGTNAEMRPSLSRVKFNMAAKVGFSHMAIVFRKFL